jgi:hypothetical protein
MWGGATEVNEIYLQHRVSAVQKTKGEEGTGVVTVLNRAGREGFKETRRRCAVDVWQRAC